MEHRTAGSYDIAIVNAYLRRCGVDTLEKRVAANMRARRLELGLTQDELAKLAVSTGAPWTQPKVALVETGRRELGLGEALLLGNILGVGLERLVVGVNSSEVEDISVAGSTVPIHQLRRMLAGEPVLTFADHNVKGVAGWAASVDSFLIALLKGHQRRLREAAHRYGLAEDGATLDRIDATAHGHAEQEIARRVGASSIEVAAASLALWGHRVLDEREHRRTEECATRPRQQITTELIEELAEFI